MNTRKQVFLMGALILASMIVMGIYAAWYPSREKNAQAELADKSATRASILFALNCRICHGNVGEGGKAGFRLALAPALDRGDLQGFIDTEATLSAGLDESSRSVSFSGGSAESSKRIKGGSLILIDAERVQVKAINGNSLTVDRGIGHTEPTTHSQGASLLIQDKDTLDDKVKLITNTITCGRVGTPMPIWGQSQGGILSDEQIRQLTILITDARWDLVKEEGDRDDLIAAKLLDDVSEDSLSVKVNDVSAFSEKDAIRIGDERLRVTAVPKLAKDEKDKSGIILVQRGILGTTPLPHTADEKIRKFLESSEPSINQASCGQTAKPAAPPAQPKLVEPFDGQKVDLIASNITFNLKEISVKVGGKVRIRLDNQDAGAEHNIAVYKSKADTTAGVSTGSIGTIIKGPSKDDTVFDVPAAGTYYFRCDVHPTIMFGNFVVTP